VQPGELVALLGSLERGDLDVIKTGNRG